MFHYLNKIIFNFLFLIMPVLVYAADNHFSLDVQDASIASTLQTIAKFMRQNIIVSHSVSGSVSIHVHDVSPQKTFMMLLKSYDLAKIPIGDAWFITANSEWMVHEQNEFKLQDAIDTASPIKTRVWQIHYAKAEDIARLLQDNNSTLLSKRGHVRVDSRTNILCVQDIQQHLNQVQQLLVRVDVPVQQVAIETHLASIDSDFERKLGFDFSVNTATNATQSADSNNSNQGYSLLVATLADGSLLNMKLNALENAGHGELISSPHLFAANQQTASIEAGEEIPYQEVSKSGATAVAFKKAVLSLKVTPQIMPNNKVLLQIQVNQDKPSNRMVLGVPAINTRQISTNVLVNNGQTIVLGGIYETNKEQAEQGIPFVNKIPVLGWLFQQHDVRQNKRELLIFVTPSIMAST